LVQQVLSGATTMTDMTWHELEAAFWRLYHNEAYTEALDLITRHADLFPSRLRLHHWRMCMAARTSDVPLALQELGQAVAEGYWYNQESLREDADLDRLQGLPEFERLTAICQARHSAAQEQAMPLLTTVQPNDQSGPYPLLIALHGNYGNIEDSIDFWRLAVARGWLLALPQSSQIAEPGAYIWDDRDRAVREVQQHYAALCAGYPVDRARVVVAGFSRGGTTAAWLALSGAVAARGFIAVAPGGPSVESLAQLLEPGPTPQVRGYIVGGEQDTGYYHISQDMAALLRKHRVPFEIETYADLGHEFPPEFERDLIKALEFVLQD
jgi:dienelactone hydrolase